MAPVAPARASTGAGWRYLEESGGICRTAKARVSDSHEGAPRGLFRRALVDSRQRCGRRRRLGRSFAAGRRAPLRPTRRSAAASGLP